MAGQCGYEFEYIGRWDHPRNQMMAAFRPRTP